MRERGQSVKNYSQGAKKRAKKAMAGMPELAATPKRQPNGQRRERADAPQDQRKTALQARARHFGNPDTKKGRDALSGQHNGCQMGMVIEAKAGRNEVGPLWRVFSDWCAAEDGYRKRYVGQSEHPKGAAIQMVPDRMETDASHSVDLRDADTKDRDAVNRWMRWQGYLGELAPGYVRVLHDARLERAPIWRDQRPTQRGYDALAALRRLRDAVEKRG